MAFRASPYFVDLVLQPPQLLLLVVDDYLVAENRSPLLLHRLAESRILGQQFIGTWLSHPDRVHGDKRVPSFTNTASAVKGMPLDNYRTVQVEHGA